MQRPGDSLPFVISRPLTGGRRPGSQAREAFIAGTAPRWGPTCILAGAGIRVKLPGRKDWARQGPGSPEGGSQGPGRLSRPARQAFRPDWPGRPRRALKASLIGQLSQIRPRAALPGRSQSRPGASSMMITLLIIDFSELSSSIKSRSN